MTNLEWGLWYSQPVMFWLGMRLTDERRVMRAQCPRCGRHLPPRSGTGRHPAMDQGLDVARCAPIELPIQYEGRGCMSNDGNAFRGMVYGLAFCIPFWALFTLLVWWVF